MKGFVSLFGWAASGLVLGTVALAGYTGYQAVQVKSGLETVAGEISPVLQDLQALDESSVRERLVTIQDAAAQAADNAQGPGWSLAGRAPLVGDDVEAVQTVTEVADRVARTVLPDVVQAGSAIKNLDTSDGRTALLEAEEAASSLAKAQARLRRQEARVAAIRVDELDPRLAAPIERLQIELRLASDLLDRISREARHARSMVPPRP